MKKKIIISTVCVLFILLALLGYFSIGKLNRKGKVAKNQEQLSKVYNLLGVSNFDTDKLTVLFYFNSECEHCQWEMTEISKHINSFRNYQLLLISFEPQAQAIQFLDKYNLSKFYLAVKSEKVMFVFTGGVPQTLIYKEGTLAKHFRGEVKIEAILEQLEK